MDDFVACARVGRLGADTFKELEELIAEKTTALLRVKISDFEVHNRYLDGKLIRTSADLRAYRDYNLVAYFEENWSLKAELETMSGVQKQLDEAHTKTGEQAKKIAEIPTLRAELQKVQDKLEEAEAEKKRKEIEQLKKDKINLTKRVPTGAVAGFTRCLQMALVLEPTLDTNLLKVEHKAVDGKIMHKGKVLYVPFSESSPGNMADVGTDAPAAKDEANPVAADQSAVEAEGGKNM